MINTASILVQKRPAKMLIYNHNCHYMVVCINELQTFMLVSDSYRKTSNIRGTLVGNKIVDHSDVVGASPVGAAPTTSSFST